MEQIQYFTDVLPQKDMAGVMLRETLDTRFVPPCKMFLDQATHTGYAIFDSKNSLVCVGALDKTKHTTLAEYKFAMQNRITELIPFFTIEHIIFEEVFHDTNTTTTETLLYVKHAITDLEHLTGVKVDSTDNRKWKMILARPNKFNATDEKAEVKKYVKAAYPLLFTGVYANALTEDMIDVIGMGIALLMKVGRTTNLLTALKYNKTLPIRTFVVTDLSTPLEEQLATTRKRSFKSAFAKDGMFILDTNVQNKVYDGLRQYLCHRDGVAAVKITPDFREWGVMLLELDVPIAELGTDKSFWLLAIKNK